MATIDSRSQAVERLMTEFIGLYDEVERSGLCDTPARVARAYESFLSPPEVKITTFPVQNYNEIISSSGISFFSLCEHHLLPFFGVAVVAYVPRERIVGLSKMSRLVDYYARRFQIQERMGHQIATRLMEALEPQGVGIALKARHLCQEMRGVKKENVYTITTALRGCFRKPGMRTELLNLLWQT